MFRPAGVCRPLTNDASKSWSSLSITTDGHAGLLCSCLACSRLAGTSIGIDGHVMPRQSSPDIFGQGRWQEAHQRAQCRRLSITADALATLLLLLLVLLCAGGNLSGGGSRDFLLLGLATALLLGLLNDGFGVGGLALALVGAVDSGEGTLLDRAGGGEGRGRGGGSCLLATTLQGRLGSLDWGRSGLLLLLIRGAVIFGVIGLGGDGSRGRLLDVFVVGIGAVSSDGSAIGLEVGELLVVDIARGNVCVLVLLLLGSAIAQG
jgi:hypothetical protein